jgi:hypothetical protein
MARHASRHAHDAPAAAQPNAALQTVCTQRLPFASQPQPLAGTHSAPLTGVLIEVSLHLHGNPQEALQRLPYLGGVLHGLLTSHWVENLGTSARWTVLAPAAQMQPTLKRAWLDEVGAMRFCVLWHSSTLPAGQAAKALQKVRTVSLGHERHEVRQVETRLWPWWGQFPDGSLDLETLALAGSPSSTLVLEWRTPLHMASRARVAAGAARTPPAAAERSAQLAATGA